MVSAIISTFLSGRNSYTKTVITDIVLFHFAKYFISAAVSGKMPRSPTTKIVHSYKASLPQQRRGCLLQHLVRFKFGKEGYLVLFFSPPHLVTRKLSLHMKQIRSSESLSSPSLPESSPVRPMQVGKVSA